MKFFGRKAELEALEREYKRDSGFVVVYGRRRVGKTTLIKNFIKDKISFYFLATKEVEMLCMKRFGKLISNVTGNLQIEKAKYDDWYDYFKGICDYKTNEKKIVVIDEFPYLVKNNPAFPSVLQHIWDELLCDNNIMLILCGSLISMMKKYALSYNSPLYGRRTSQLNLLPLSFCEICENQQKKTFDKIVLQYAVTGGIPKYIVFFDNDMSLIENIKANVLNNSGFLYEEPAFLLEDEVKAPNVYFSILKSICDGNRKISKIASSLGMNVTSLMPYISTLSELNFIERRIPVTEDNPEKSKKGLYYVSDNYIRFWFKYVWPYKGELEFGNVQIAIDEINKNFETDFVPFIYEDICKNIFINLCENKQLNFCVSKIGSYWQNDNKTDNVEIDVIAVDNQNKKLFLGECKYHSKPVDIDVFYSLSDKYLNSIELKNKYKDYEIIYGIFSRSGFTNKLIKLAKETSLVLIDKMKLYK